MLEAAGEVVTEEEEAESEAELEAELAAEADILTAEAEAILSLAQACSTDTLSLDSELWLEPLDDDADVDPDSFLFFLLCFSFSNLSSLIWSMKAWTEDFFLTNGGDGVLDFATVDGSGSGIFLLRWVAVSEVSPAEATFLFNASGVGGLGGGDFFFSGDNLITGIFDSEVNCVKLGLFFGGSLLSARSSSFTAALFLASGEVGGLGGGFSSWNEIPLEILITDGLDERTDTEADDTTVSLELVFQVRLLMPVLPVDPPVDVEGSGDGGLLLPGGELLLLFLIESRFGGWDGIPVAADFGTVKLLWDPLLELLGCWAGLELLWDPNP